jgi:DNA-binding IclR family transcriptional regulator
VARPAPSVERTIAVLKLLADHPRDRFSLSDIARRLNSNKATCHAMLSELVDKGMLIRHLRDKTYMLGPALVGIGSAAAREAHEALDRAQGEMAAIRDELGVSCVATAAVGGEIIIMGRQDASHHLAGYLPVGHRSPHVPPYGAEFLAWSPQEEIDAWLDLHEPSLSAHERDGCYQVLNRIRLAAYHATSFEQVRMLRDLIEQLGDLPGAATLGATLRQLADRPLYQVDYHRELDRITAVMAPVFGPGGQVVLALNIGQLHNLPSGGNRIDECAQRLLAATRRVTAALHGTEPFPLWARPVESGGRLHDPPAPGEPPPDRLSDQLSDQAPPPARSTRVPRPRRSPAPRAGSPEGTRRPAAPTAPPVT